MTIANLTERLLFFTKQKSFLNLQLSNIQMQQVAATRKSVLAQNGYNAELQELYYDPYVGYGTDEYVNYLVELQNDHEFEMAALTAWESQLENQKEAYETELNEVTQYESSWQKLLQQNIKSEFTYGSGAGGK